MTRQEYIDLLPIKNPLNDNTQIDETFFYNNVVSKLIPDILQIESNGIPISLDKVQELENTLINVLQLVRDKLSKNKLMLKFLEYEKEKNTKNKIQELKSKKKDWKDFLKPFDISNKVHRSYTINTYLIAQNKEDMCMEEWSIKDLKKLNQILASNFLQALIDKDINIQMDSYINASMELLAKDKAYLYNKNKIETKINEQKEESIISSFNPGSSLQKINFFKYYNIQSENETKKGNPQWNRKELEKLYHYINVLLDEKGGLNVSLEMVRS